MKRVSGYNSFFIVVELHDGTKETFSIPDIPNNEIIEKLRFKEFFNSNYLIFSTDDDVLLFPVTSVRSVRMSKSLFSKSAQSLDSLLPVSSFKNANRI
ncbi:hypothetical protein GCM10028811_03430 [Uliginosibacterium sediminicola]